MVEVIPFEAILSQFTSSPLWGWHFIVPNDIASRFIIEKDRRVICEINGLVTLHCALMPNKDTWFIMLNQGVIKKIDVPLHGQIHVRLYKDNSTYGMPMSPEFREVLDQEPDADHYFHELTPGKQRSLLYIVNQVKNSDSRIRKSLAIADHLKANKGGIDYKQLIEAFKAYKKM